VTDASTTANVPARTSNTDAEPFRQLVSELETVAQLDTAATDSFEFAAAAVNRIASATTIDELFDAAEKSGEGLQSMGKDWRHLGDKIGVYDLRFRKSDEKYREHGLGTMAVVEYLTTEGESFIVGVGAPNVVSSLRRFQTLGAFSEGKPFWLRVRSKSTGNGEMLYITRP
jgi:hypothetical protein